MYRGLSYKKRHFKRPKVWDVWDVWDNWNVFSECVKRSKLWKDVWNVPNFGTFETHFLIGETSEDLFSYWESIFREDLFFIQLVPGSAADSARRSGRSTFPPRRRRRRWRRGRAPCSRISEVAIQKKFDWLELWLENQLEFWLEISYTEKKFNNG